VLAGGAALGDVPGAAAEPGRLWHAPVAVGHWPPVVAVLGDSVPSGAACHCTPYGSLVALALAQGAGRAARTADLARGGATVATLRDQLRTPSVRAAVASSGLAVVTVGANDLSPDPLTDPGCRPVTALACYRGDVDRLSAGLAAVLADLRSLIAPGGGRVLVTGYWNVFLDGAVGRARGGDYVTGSDALTRAVDAGIADAARRSGATYVDVYTPFKGDGTRDCTALLAADGDHPNARGHRLIADTVLATLVTTAP